MQILFQVEMNPGDLTAIIDAFLEGEEADKESKEFVEMIVKGTIEHLPEIDKLIEQYATNWHVSRMGRVDRNVMRVAVYEMLHRNDIPPIVSINEAVDIVKNFGDKESGKFVNGILDRIKKDLKRPSR